LFVDEKQELRTILQMIYLNEKRFTQFYHVLTSRNMHKNAL